MSILRLQHSRNDGETDTYHLKSVRRYHIGRGSQCEVRILDMKMSRKHCAVEMIDGRWFLLDIGSTNGVRLNDTKVDDRAPLSPGCLIEAGATTLRVSGITGWESSDDLDTASTTRPQTAALKGGPEAAALEPSQDQDHYDRSPTRLGPATDPDTPPPIGESAEAPLEPTPLHQDQTRAVEQLANTPQPAAAVPPPPPPRQRPEPTTAAEPEPVDVPPPAPASTPPAHEVERNGQGKVKPVTVRVGQTTPPSDDAPAEEERPKTERRIIITLLGHKVGPLSRTEAKDLKARELKGTLTEADITHLIRE